MLCPRHIVETLGSIKFGETSKNSPKFIAKVSCPYFLSISTTSSFLLTTPSTQDIEEHAVLLCSLLLGFGLNAYVVVGTKSKGQAHMWVMTLGADPEGRGVVTFWEGITGQRYVQPNFDPNAQAGKPLPLPTHPYRTVGCVFNHTHFYANAQPSDAVSTCRFDLTNESHWKAMSSEAIK